MYFLLRVIQGMLIGTGAVLPGVSGGVLCVVFGLYTTVMEFLASPFKRFSTHVPRLIPVALGGVIGFLGIANILSVLLEKYPSESVCVFIGLITGMLPSLFREAKNEDKSSNKTSCNGEAKDLSIDFTHIENTDMRAANYAMYVSMTVIFVLLVTLKLLEVNIIPGFTWYLFCGFCLALSVIAPGMSFSTLLMPLGLYEPFVSGIGSMELYVVVPGAVGAVITVLVLSKAINRLFEKYYTISFYAIIGIVIAATVMIIPFNSFISSVGSFMVNSLCIIAGVTASAALDKFNQRFV